MPQAAKIAEENGFGDVISYIQGKAESGLNGSMGVQLLKVCHKPFKKGVARGSCNRIIEYEKNGFV